MFANTYVAVCLGPYLYVTSVSTKLFVHIYSPTHSYRLVTKELEVGRVRLTLTEICCRIIEVGLVEVLTVNSQASLEIEVLRVIRKEPLV